VARLLPPEQRDALSELGAVQYELPPRVGLPGRFTVIAARGGDDIWLEIRYHRPPRPQVTFEPMPAAMAGAGAPAPARRREAVAEEVQSAQAPETAPTTERVSIASVTPGVAVEGIAAPAPAPAAEALGEVPVADVMAREDRAVCEPGAPGERAERPELEASQEAVEPLVAAEPPLSVALAERPQPAAAPERASELDASREVELVAPPPPLAGTPVLVREPGTAAEAEARAERLGETGETLEGVASAEEVETVYDLSSALADLSTGAGPISPPPFERPADETVAIGVSAGGEAPPSAEETPAEAIRPQEEAAEAAVGVELGRAPSRDSVAVPLVAPAPPERPVAEAGVEAAEPVPAAAAAPSVPSAPGEAEEPPRPAVVLPLARGAPRVEAPPPLATPRSPLERLLRLAAARGASALYIVAQSRPVLRVEGEIRVLEAEEVLAGSDVAAMLMELAPEPTRDALRTGAVTEWICDVPEVGRVRCMSFRDHRGPGGIFRMLPARALSVEQLGLSRTIQGLCEESEGLVLVAGPRASGKSTLVSAFVDLINRTRADHVITLESQILFVHESRRSFVSQRELRESAGELAAAARAALREDPDVLVIDDLRSPELVSVAIEAAGSGRLVFAALPAAGATAAVERVIDCFPTERRAQVQTALAATLRAVVAQVLVRKIGGGRVAAREVLLGTRPVAALLAEGRTAELPHAIEGGRRHGMVSLNDALSGLVRTGLVDPAEAYRRTPDKEGLLAQLRRDGVDTSFVERLA
jgi:twitching motility protein PilT